MISKPGSIFSARSTPVTRILVSVSKHSASSQYMNKESARHWRISSANVSLDLVGEVAFVITVVLYWRGGSFAVGVNVAVKLKETT